MTRKENQLNSESDMEWFARVYALQESRIAELETSLDAINGKEAVRYRRTLERLRDAEDCPAIVRAICTDSLND
jgi:hypothetical protein